jgi:HTH-type transcriptional regulator/antitoxin HigA
LAAEAPRSRFRLADQGFDRQNGRTRREDEFEIEQARDLHQCLDILIALVESYEARTWPAPEVDADPIGVIRVVMDENGYAQKDLADVLGSRSRASELLNGHRELTLDQIRRLS